GMAIDFLFRRGAQDVTAICLLGAPEGVAAIERQVGDRDVTLVLGALDERLNDKGYIVPGLGDAGDRLYGTVGGSRAVRAPRVRRAPRVPRLPRMSCVLCDFARAA